MTANSHFEQLGALFPLTAALSLWEREKLSQLPGEVMAGFCSTTLGFLKNVPGLFPLPTGEGQGEGKGG